MLKNVISVFLIFRLKSRPAPLDFGAALTAWLRRPSIELFVAERHQDQVLPGGEQLKRKLNEVYPF